MKRKIYYLIIMLFMFCFFNINVKAYTYKTSDIPNNSYVIGTYLFTRSDLNDNYKGTLKTEHIMLGSKSIMSDNLDDMIIYYKDPRGNWYSELTDELVQMEDEINIEYKNTVPYLLKPILNVNCIGYENGYYNYETGIENLQEYIDEINDQNELSKYKFEVYEKTDNGISNEPIITDGVLDEKITLSIEAGTQKILVTRVYTVDSEEHKNYSDYSDEVVIDKTKTETATLEIKTIRYDMNNHNYVFEVFPKEQIDYELHEKINDEYKFINEYSIGTSSFIIVNVGESKTVVCKSFVLNSEGNKVLSEYSEELILNGNLENKNPEIIENFVEYNNGNYVYNIKLNNACNFLANGSDGECSNPLVTNLELYKKENDKYTRIDGILWDSKEDFISYNVSLGEKVDLSVRMYVINNQGERKYTDYSNVITIDKTDVQLENPYNNIDFGMTLGKLAYAISDVDGDDTEELILRGPFSKKVDSKIAYKIIKYENGNTYLYKNMERDEIDLVGFDNYNAYKVYKNNDKSLIFVTGIGTPEGYNQEVDKITFNDDNTLNENRTFTYIEDEEHLLTGDVLINFYNIDNKEYLNNVITDENLLSKYKEILDLHYNNFTYAYTDINQDGKEELIVKTLYGKDLSSNYEIFSYNFDEEVGQNRIYSLNNDDNIVISNNLEQYLYQNDDNTLMIVSKYLEQDKEIITKYNLNSNSLFEISTEEHDIINGQMTIGDHLITMNKYNFEDKGC